VICKNDIRKIETCGIFAHIIMFGFKRKTPAIVKDPPAALPLASEEVVTKGLLARLKDGMSKTSTQLSGGITGIFTKRKLDAASLEELEELLILSDMGVTVAASMVASLRKERFEKECDADDIRRALATEIEAILAPVERPLLLSPDITPTVIMVVGVNGNGKTTTIGKLAMRYKSEGKRVMVAAADTFRAAAVEQLALWAERSGVPLVTGVHAADPASVAYQALERARAENMDVLLIDTAGRLQNKHNLMEELAKITRVLGKMDAAAPHHTLMVLDGTTGQNALSQVATFHACVGITGVAITKLDGTAKGGMVVALAEKFALPVHYIGVGEQIDDLQTFTAHDFSLSLVGVEE
jgi:fused signal recognition particle receptor